MEKDKARWKLLVDGKTAATSMVDNPVVDSELTEAMAVVILTNQLNRIDKSLIEYATGVFEELAPPSERALPRG